MFSDAWKDANGTDKKGVKAGELQKSIHSLDHLMAEKLQAKSTKNDQSIFELRKDDR